MISMTMNGRLSKTKKGLTHVRNRLKGKRNNYNLIFIPPQILAEKHLMPIQGLAILAKQLELLEVDYRILVFLFFSIQVSANA